MDTTTGGEDPTVTGGEDPTVTGGEDPTVTGADDSARTLIDSLRDVDPAEAPEIAGRIAALLTEELDDVPGEAHAEQLRAFDGAPEA
jgi:hypothetical protein